MKVSSDLEWVEFGFRHWVVCFAGTRIAYEGECDVADDEL